MATYSSVIASRIPGTAEPGGLLSMGSHRVGHDWSNLAAAAAWHVDNCPSFLTWHVKVLLQNDRFVSFGFFGGSYLVEGKVSKHELPSNSRIESKPKSTWSYPTSEPGSCGSQLSETISLLSQQTPDLVSSFPIHCVLETRVPTIQFPVFILGYSLLLWNLLVFLSSPTRDVWSVPHILPILCQLLFLPR